MYCFQVKGGNILSKKIEEYLCPGCGAKMTYVGGLLDWECPSCGAEGSVEYDNVNKEYYIDVAESYSYKEIYADPSCMTSCKIFDS